MKALQSFTVRPLLPDNLKPLTTLAMNLRWSWDRDTRALFERIDPSAWEETIHDPIAVLGTVSPDRLDALAQDTVFVAEVAEAAERLERYRLGDRWFQGRTSPLRGVAYFSPEFGIAEALPQYSGGLGILAGDHLKAASDLGVPLVGVGLFYRHGYFRQSLDVDGWQQERFPNLDPYSLPLELVEGAGVTVDLAGQPLHARIWRADVGRIPLYLLDADVDENPPECRMVTDRLYGGDTEHRLRQEMLLGIGGVRALQSVGVPAQVFHTNEGHAGFLGLERIRQLITEEGLSYPEAIEAARAGSLFTTHTPVPAGIDRFPRELMERYFGGWAQECGISLDQLMGLGHRGGDETDDRFNMAVMGLRLAAHSNGVSQLHGEVSRDMFNDLWPDVPIDETPISSITNGVHGRTWVSAEVDGLLSDQVGPEWPGETAAWNAMADMDRSRVWSVRRTGRERLVNFVRDKLHRSGRSRGLSESDLAWTRTVFDPDALTIGFARRFATYKRANLLLTQPDRLKALLTDDERPVQFVFAGKAHPADDQGKELIRQVVDFSHSLGIRHRFAFLDDYDIAVARALYHGTDVWLNNPRRPLEACGTSGEKAALNGALNCSILDGWWDEMFDGDNGWAISSADGIEDEERRDQLEANSLFGLLEQQVIPLFHDRSADGLPHGWLDKMQANWTGLGPQVTASRMVRDYVEGLYEPIAARADRLQADDRAKARDLAEWKRRVVDGWHTVHIDRVEADDAIGDLGGTREVGAVVALGRLYADDVEVQLLHGPVGQYGELDRAEVVSLQKSEQIDDQHLRFSGTLPCDHAGRYGFTVRIMPTHRDLANPVELGVIAWPT